MNNRGFTLIELLAVIAILAGISVIAVSGISSSIQNRDDRELKEQQELAISAAKIYFSLNPDPAVNSIMVSDLINDGYYSETSKTDKLNMCDTIEREIINGKYNGNLIYNSAETCELTNSEESEINLSDN